MKPAERIGQAIESLQGQRPQGRAPGTPQRRGMTPLRWILGTIAAAPLGSVAVLVLGSDTLGDVSSLVATYLLDVLRSVLGLFR